MWQAVIDALMFGVKVTVWIFKKIFEGYAEVIRWFEAKGRGDYYQFPVLQLLLSLVLTAALIWFVIMINSR